jgi:putative holliday junction resolvase
MSMQQSSSILALDVGTKRIGVAIADAIARLPRPLTTLQSGENILKQIADLAAEHNANEIVVGLPRGLNGQSTAQTTFTEEFARKLKQQTGILVHMQDEAVTSAQAEEELRQAGKSYSKGDIDALAATYILEDFLR